MRDWTREEIQRIGYQVVDLIADHLSNLPSERVFLPVPPALARQFITTPAPLDAVSPEDMLRAFQETIEPYPFGNGHPRFWGWVNSPPAMMGVFAEFERAMIRDRVKAGLANARAKGVRLGAPRTDAKMVTRIEREKAKGLSAADQKCDQRLAESPLIAAQEFRRLQSCRLCRR